MSRKLRPIEEMALDDAAVLVRDLFPGLEQAMKETEGKRKGKLVITAEIACSDLGVLTLEVSGKAVHPDKTQEQRKLAWHGSQLDLFSGAES